MSGFDVSSTVKLNMPVLEELTESAMRALELTTEALLGEIKDAEVIPFDTGNLQDNTFPDFDDLDKGVARIVSDTPYARRLYYHPEYNFSRKEHSNAKGKWFEDWLPGGSQKDYAAETFAEFYRKLNGL